jgi:hypothetical protein
MQHPADEGGVGRFSDGMLSQANQLKSTSTAFVTTAT